MSDATPPIPWELLTEKAREMETKAYAPYSRYHVGAAGLTEDGRIILGCNVENSSYGVTLCAECGVVSQLHATGGGKFVAIVATGNGEVTLPCGRCRQVLAENGGASLLVACPDGEKRSLEELLPGLVESFNDKSYQG